MLWLSLSDIKVCPGYQFRETPWSTDTVMAIVREGFDAAKFDPLPVFDVEGQWYVGGDGHSRYEALKRLAKEGRAPDAIPCRPIDQSDAERVAYTANMSRTPYTPAEEAAIFQRRLDNGESISVIATTSGKNAAYVKDRLALMVMPETLRRLVCKEYGMTLQVATAFAKAAREYGLDAAQQDALYREVISKGDYTPHMIRAAMAVFADQAKESSSDGLLFELPANLAARVAEVTQAGSEIEAACRALRSVRKYAHVFSDPLIREALGEAAAVEIESLERTVEHQYRALGKHKPGSVRPSSLTDTGARDRVREILRATVEAA